MNKIQNYFNEIIDEIVPNSKVQNRMKFKSFVK